MMRSGLLALLILMTFKGMSQPHQLSLGVFSGITTTYTWNEGIHNDSRYRNKYNVKPQAIGIHYGVDFQEYGFILNPSVFTIGQDFHIINNVGGHEGTRKNDLTYLNLPFAFKAHVIDMAFFRISLLAGGGVGYLMKGEETVTHNYAKFRFPSTVFPALPPDYIVEYDGVLAPPVDKLAIVETADFKPLQFFACAGFRSDWDLSDNWRISLDMRVNYCITEPRTTDYLNRAAAYETIYDMPGKRRDIFATANISFSRYIEIDKERDSKIKPVKRFKPQKNPFKPRHRTKQKRKKNRN